MPEQQTIKRAHEDARQGKSPSTQAGEFVREEFHHIRQGKHGARSTKQAIAIGLSKARRAGVKLPAPRSQSPKVRRQAQRDLAKGRHDGIKHVSRTRARATLGALKHEGRGAASTRAISRQMRSAARRRSSTNRSSSARKAAKTRMHRRTGRSTTMRIRRGSSLLSARVHRLARDWMSAE